MLDRPRDASILSPKVTLFLIEVFAKIATFSVRRDWDEVEAMRRLKAELLEHFFWFLLRFRWWGVGKFAIVMAAGVSVWGLWVGRGFCDIYPCEMF